MKRIISFAMLFFCAVMREKNAYPLSSNDYIFLEERLKYYKDNVHHYEHGYTKIFLKFAFAGFIPLFLLRFGCGDVNNKMHLFFVSASFVLALYGAGFLYFESNHRDEPLARHVLNLTNGHPPKLWKRFLYWIVFTGVYTLLVWVLIFLIAGKNPMQFIIILFGFVNLIYFYFEISMNAWYKIQSNVKTLISSLNENNDTKAINIVRNWYRKLGFKCLVWAAVMGLIDIVKDGFGIKF